MADFITLTCPSCGGKLEITNDVDRFACAHCGQEHIVKRSGGTVSLSPVVDALKKVGAGVDKTAAELAISRIQREITGLQIARSNLLSANPRPALSPAVPLTTLLLGIALLGIGIIITCSVGGSNDPNHTALPASIACLVPGVLLLILSQWLPKNYHPNTSNWDQTIGVQIKSLDAQIAVKEAELQRNKDFVYN